MIDSFAAIKFTALANDTADAFSYSKYGWDEWMGCIQFLSETGYNNVEIEWILRSKYMRWAADNYDATAYGFRKYYYQTVKSINTFLGDM